MRPRIPEPQQDPPAHPPRRAARRQQAERRPQAVTRRLPARYCQWPFHCGPTPDSGTPAGSRLTKIDPREEDTMHPDILRQLAAEHTRDLMTEAGEAVRAREPRPTPPRRPATPPRPSHPAAAPPPPPPPASL